MDLSLDVATLRAKAKERLVEGILKLVQEYQDVDAFERLVIAARTDRATPVEVDAVPARVPVSRRIAGALRSGVSNTTELRNASRAMLKNHPEGLTTGDLMRRLDALGNVFPSSMSEASKRGAIARLLTPEFGFNREHRVRGPGGEMVYTLPTESIARAKPRRRANGAATSVAQVRKLIVARLLAADGKPVSPKEITAALMASGIPPTILGDRLSNYTSRILRELLSKRQVKRIGRAGQNVRYTLLRPSIDVSKEGE